MTRDPTASAPGRPVGLDVNGLTATAMSVSATIDAGVALLPAESRQRLAELAVFPGDTDVALQKVAHLWRTTGGLDQFEALKLLDTLSSLALVSFNGESVRLHGVIRDYFQRVIGTDLTALEAIIRDEPGTD